MESPTTIHILLADDDKDDRYFFEKSLQDVPIKIALDIVTNGEYLMTYLHDHIANLPDVIFLDLNMPRKNGSECLVAIKAEHAFSHIPIVIYSTVVREGVADDLYAKGAHYYLQKCNFNEIAGAITAILNLIHVDSNRPSRSAFVLN
jgi:CheY-like chemotaxis protein